MDGMDRCITFAVCVCNYKVCTILKGLKICYAFNYNMFRTLIPNLYKNFYSTIPEFHSHTNYNNNGGGGNDPKLFYLFLLGLTLYSVNKLKK